MSDRVLRDEILKSDRWLDLPTDSHRLVYVGLLLLADDYGNLEGGPRRLYRWMNHFTQIKAEVDAIKLMSDLQDSDMVRRYEIADKEYWHLPRFMNSRRYWSRSCPASPFAEQQIPIKQKDRQKTPQKRRNPPRGVGVGVGEVTTLAQTAFARFWAIYPRKQNKGTAEKAFAKLNPDAPLLQTLLSSVQQAVASSGWQREGGRYIPHPASWLNARGWEDELAPAAERKVAL